MSDERADLAVVIVNYNTGFYLERCLSSVQEAAGDARVEIVVIDNHSSDASAAVTAERAGVALIRNESNRGFAAAVNQGIRASTAPFVLLLNPDAEILSGTLGGFLKVARERPRTGAVGALVRDPNGHVYPSARKLPTFTEAIGHSFLGPFWPNNPFTRAYTLADWDRQAEREVEWVSGSCMLLSRAALDEVGVLDERFFIYVEDADICRRLRAGGWRVLFSPELEVRHVGGVSTGGSKRMTLEHSKSIYRFFVKYHPGAAWVPLRPAVWGALRARAALVSWRRGER